MITNLDPSQRRFCEGPLVNARLLAPAGCGKTQCLLQRSQYLVDSASGQPPRILIVTFTRVAREELKARLVDIDLGQSVEVTTLNAWGFRRIKNAFDYPKLITTKTEYHFAMLNQLQSLWQRKKHRHIKAAIQTSNRWRRANAPRMLMDMIDVFKSLGFDHVRHATEDDFLGHWERLESQRLEWRILEQVDKLRSIDVIDPETSSDALILTKSDKKKVYKRFFLFWRDATKHLAAEATFTLEDQKYFAYQDEQQHVDKGRYLAGAARLNHVFVDEFQDINPLDLALIRAIADRNKSRLTIAGDDDQAIFEWRGATPDYIIDPATFLGRAFKTYLLGVNYRSPRNIVECSQALISHNDRRVEKQVRAATATDAQIDVKEVHGIHEAMSFVSSLVRTAIGAGQSPSQVALIGRKRAQLIPYQIHFASNDIHFSAVEDLQVFLSAAFDSLLELLDVKCMPPRSSRVTSKVLDLCDLVKRYPLSKLDRDNLRKHLTRKQPQSVSEGADCLASYEGDIKRSKSTAAEMSNALSAFFAARSVSETLEVLAGEFEGLQYDFGKAEDDIFFTDPPFKYLAQFAEEYDDDFDRFVEDIEKAKDTLVHIPPFEEGSAEPVSSHPLHLMTALRSKGKEFDIVVMLDVVDGVWPHKNAESKEQLESERRVFYVAFTRARERVVFLTDSRQTSSPYVRELGLNRKGRT